MDQRPRRRTASRPAGPPTSRPDNWSTAEPGEPAAPSSREPSRTDSPLATPPPETDHPDRGPRRRVRGARTVEPPERPEPPEVAESRGPTKTPATPAFEDPGDRAAGETSPPAHHVEPPEPRRAPKPRRDRGSRSDSEDRSLRALVSLRGTQVPTDLAVRAREFATPTPEDLAAADAEVVLVRRHYVPSTPLTTGSRRKDETARTDEQSARDGDRSRARRREQRG